ncbi:MAG: hypothetical protein ACLR43_04890 [Faecalibacillus faecis]
MVPPLASCHADASFIAYLGIKQGYDLYKNGSTQNQYIDAHFIPRLSVDCENHEETEIGEFIRFCRAEKESNEYIAQGMTQYVLIINWFIVPIIKNCMEFLYLFIGSFGKRLYETSRLSTNRRLY